MSVNINFNKLSSLTDLNLTTHKITPNLEGTRKYSTSLRAFINVITFGIYGAYLKNQMISVAKKIADVINHKTELVSSGITEKDISEVEQLAQKIAVKIENSRHTKAYKILSSSLALAKQDFEQEKAKDDDDKFDDKKFSDDKPKEEQKLDKPVKNESDIRPDIKESDTHIKKVHHYPGDLTSSELSKMKSENPTGLMLKVNFPDNMLDVTIRAQDLFCSGAEVLVNAANTHLGGGGGIDGAIHSKGGEAYAKAHKKLKTKYNSNYVRGYAEMIESGKLKKKCEIENVIVVAGPQGSSTQRKESQLYSCYYNSLVLANLHNKKSIAFPSISTGIFGFPKDRAAQISLRAIHDFVSKYPKGSLRTISIHFLDDKSLKDYENVLKQF